MGKNAEVDYVAKMVEVLQVSVEEVQQSLRLKPFNDPRLGAYLIDMGQLFKLLPPPPQRLVDLGCGPGWTSRMFAMAGYDVTGMDLCPDMINLANQDIGTCSNLRFLVHDYEESIGVGCFNVAVIYDALHHATDPAAVVRSVYQALQPGGVFVTAEPGVGHSKAEGSIQAKQRFGTTEEDMPFLYQYQMMMDAGFRGVRQYLRLSELPLVPFDKASGGQLINFSALAHNTEFNGFTSFVVATK
jgi:SAM-dependent methyltransferase